MRCTFITFFIIIISLIGAGSIVMERNYRPFDKVLKEMINTSQLNTYKDSVFGYKAKYPDFFDTQPDSLREYAGDARFSFSNVIQIDMETTVNRKIGSDTKKSIDSIAHLLHAKVKRMDKDSFILTGAQYDNSGKIDGCSQYCKYVAKGRLWFVYSLYYPDEYKKCIQRLFHIIADWEPYEESLSRNQSAMVHL